jgi:toxin YoeB
MEIIYSEKFQRDLKKLQAESQNLVEKLFSLIQDIKKNPKSGIGKPEQLRGNMSGHWSRRISQKHRLIYIIDEAKKIVILISCYNHYNDR